MRQETNNEMDRLLRRLGRRGDATARDGETSLTDGRDRHLDVDELSSYAQNALPAPARARYTEHLAECGSCRKLVTELSLSLGAVTVAAPVEAGLASSGLKSFLASLFSPMVLRYAVPALAVIAVIVIGFVALRRQQRDEFVAQLEPKPSVSETVKPGVDTPAPAAGFHDNQPRHAETEPSRGPQGAAAKRDSAGKKNDAAGGGAGSAPTKQSDESARNEAQSATRPLAVTEAPPPAAPKIVADGETQETSKEKKAEAEPRKKPQPAIATTDTANKTANEPATISERRVASIPAQNRRYEDLGKLRPMARARDDNDAAADKDTSPTRSVAGRKFKKERGIWTDTAYDSSTDTVNLARGSEQYRALVADEPAIKTIAEQLDGEVIVVWKGRAYHIR